MQVIAKTHYKNYEIVAKMQQDDHLSIWDVHPYSEATQVSGAYGSWVEDVLRDSDELWFVDNDMSIYFGGGDDVFKMKGLFTDYLSYYFKCPEEEGVKAMGKALAYASIQAKEQIDDQLEYLQDYFNENWFYVGLTVSLSEMVRDPDSGLISSSTEPDYEDSLRRVEFNIYYSSNCEDNIKMHIQEMTPIELSDEALDELYFQLSHNDWKE